MFSAAANPYDEIITKATDENLASEDWALNLEVCDKVSGEGQPGARNAVAALQKRLAHRNPNVQLYALELANTLAQNCSKPLLEELSSRPWTGALDRLINDRTTAAPVKKKALGYIKAWAKQFEETGDPNLGVMGEYYDQLRAKNMTFDEPEPAPETLIDERQRREDEELQRVLELSKQDKGGRATYQPSAANDGSSSSAAAARQSSHHHQQPSYNPPQPAYVPPEPEPAPVDINSATRVRALYTFTSAEVGELNFERGDVIKVLDRGFQEWWRGACNGRIGIFPVTYVEAMPEPSPRELQEEAQAEAKVFASLGLVDQLLQALKAIDPSKGERIDDSPEVEGMYQASVELQGQINDLIKKYSDQKAELEHMNANFVRAIQQYEDLRRGPAAQPQYGYAPPPHDPYAGQQHPQQPPALAQQHSYDQNGYPAQHQPYPQQAPSVHSPDAQQPPYAPQPDPYQQGQQGQHQSLPVPQPHPYQGPTSPQQQQQQQPAYAPQGETAPAPGQFYQQNVASQASLHRAPTGAPDLPPSGSGPHRNNTNPGAAGLGAGNDAEAEHRAAWDAYYAAQAQAQGQQHGQAPEGVPQPAYGASPYPAQGGAGQAGQAGLGHPGQVQPPWQGHRAASGGSVGGVTGGMERMSVHGQ